MKISESVVEKNQDNFKQLTNRLIHYVRNDVLNSKSNHLRVRKQFKIQHLTLKIKIARVKTQE